VSDDLSVLVNSYSGSALLELSLTAEVGVYWTCPRALTMNVDSPWKDDLYTPISESEYVM